MTQYDIRELQRDDFDTLMALEDEVFGADGEPVLGPYYVRLCCDFFPDTCFLATVDGRPAGDILGFLRIVSRLDREVLVRLRKRSERLGFIERKRAAERAAEASAERGALEAAS